MLRDLPLANRSCMCCCSAESVDHLLIHCTVAYSLWVQMLQAFGIQWVMPGSVASLVSCWSNWLGKSASDIWNMVPGYLMWVVWLERNRRSFEAQERTLVQLQALCQNTLFEWAKCWDLQIVLLLWSSFLPLEVPLKFLLFFFFFFFVALFRCFLCSPS